MQTKIEVRVEAAKIASVMPGDFKSNFGMIYSTILCEADLPDVSPIPKMTEDVFESVKNIIESYVR
ncbi:MAG: hypothetical protein RRY36_08135 [Bacteroidaceae bacterium]